MRIPASDGHMKLMAPPGIANPLLTEDDEIHWLALRMARRAGNPQGRRN